MKIILSRSEWGWCLPDVVRDEYYRRTGTTIDRRLPEPRNDPILIDIVEKFGEDADWRNSCLEVVEVPDEYDYKIVEDDGCEYLQLCANEAYLRKLIVSGDTEAIVEYVMCAR